MIFNMPVILPSPISHRTFDVLSKTLAIILQREPVPNTMHQQWRKNNIFAFSKREKKRRRETRVTISFIISLYVCAWHTLLLIYIKQSLWLNKLMCTHIPDIRIENDQSVYTKLEKFGEYHLRLPFDSNHGHIPLIHVCTGHNRKA